MKLHSFALILVGLVLLSSVSYAEGIDSRVINGVEFTLLSNSDQCLSNCESWIKMDLSKGILTNVQLPVEKTSQFSFDVVKANDKTSDLKDFGVEVWEEKGTLIQDYRQEEEVYVINLIELQGLDVNAQSLVCEDYGCTEKEKDVCNCTRTISVPNGSHTDFAWEKVSNDFYGFEAIQGKVYRLRVWGNRKAEIGSTGVDWIPTFFGETITEWAWWDSDWKSAFPINSLQIDVDQNSTNWINLTKVDFSTLSSACADAADITVVNELTGAEVSDINFQGWDGTNTDADVNILFKLTADLATGTHTGTYYIYSNNGLCPVPTNRVVDQSAFDDFENGIFDTVASKPYWTLNAQVNQTVTVEASAAKEGSFGVKVVTAGGGSWSREVINGFDNLTYNLCGWLRTNDITTNRTEIDGDDSGAFTMGIQAGDFYAYSSDDTEHKGVAWTANPVNDTWYKFCVKKDLTTETFSIYDSTETFIEGWSTPASVETLESVMMNQGASTTGYFDNIGFMPPLEPTYVLGPERLNTPIDFNISKINGLSFLTHPKISYGLTGNVGIDFNIFILDNNRLTIDLNYSTTATNGTGVVIIKDLNLDSTICPDQDWNDVPSVCSYSWDYSTVADGNYGILGLIDSGTEIARDASDGNFEVFNEVDLNISTIDGLDYKTHPIFAHGLDGNITIDFDVYDSGNRRLLIDLNVSQSIIQGTGTVIVKDLNLTAAYCPDQDFTTPSSCSYSWNYSSIVDGNYGILGLVTNTNGLTDFNVSDGNFQITNDVNIIVLQPIDEDTGLVIPSLVVGSTIGYSVKITTNHDVRFFDDMIDLNGFDVPFQSTPIVITVDVNVLAEYYPRQYSISFSEAMASYTLQPYLAPVSKSGNFIFFVTNLTTTGPLSNVTIVINGIVPGADGVAIQEIVTDAAGTATIPLLLDTEYTALFYYAGVLVHEATIVPTAASLTYQVGLNIGSTIIPPQPIGGLLVQWLPTNLFLLQNSNGTIDINAAIWLQNKTLQSMQIRIYDTNGCLYDNNIFTADWTDGNTVAFTIDLNVNPSISSITGLPCIFDNNINLYSIFVRIDANSVDGNVYSATSVYWQVVQLNNYQWNLWYRLGITAQALNPPGTKIITSIVSFFLVFIAVFAASKTVGNSFFTAMVGLILLGMCVYFGWFDFIIFAFIAFATVMYSMYTWGKLG